ncbi:hypothetical protein IKP85_01310 [bacterium]|nr:hypothetical protein [bacterium]
MQVSPIMAVNTISGINSVTNNSNINRAGFVGNDKKDVFNPSFTSYEKALILALESDFKKESMFEKAFAQMFGKIIESDSIYKSEDFKVLADVYGRKGFWGVMKSLWVPEAPTAEIANILEKSSVTGGSLVLAKQGEKPVLELFNWGRLGWKSLFSEQKDAPRDIRLIFNSLLSNNSLECSLRSKGELKVSKNQGGNEINTIYHIVTGNKKKEVCSSGSFPETVYYNPDGSVNLLKTHILGGVAIPLW